ncbi:MAG TPA: hypothetical protein VLK89_00505 [Solirubrobacterales bacterium]|nr:hypothetical protein [Solirubrobacterales bacterium]
MERSPSTDEAAAIAAAIERFQVEMAPAGAADGETIGPWQRAALVEGVGARGTVQKHQEGGVKWLS